MKYKNSVIIKMIYHLLHCLKLFNEKSEFFRENLKFTSGKFVILGENLNFKIKKNCVVFDTSI